MQNLPADATVDSVRTLFEPFSGLMDVRVPPGGRGLGFVEYADIHSATVAQTNLQGFLAAPDRPLVISYAKR